MKDQYSLEDPDDLIRLTAAWERVLKRLGPDVPSAWFQRFIRPLSPADIQDKHVRVNAPGQFVLEWVRSRYSETITRLLSDELGGPVTIEFHTTSHARPSTPPSPSPIPVATATPTEPRFKPAEKYRFDTYVVGQSNRLAVAGAKAVSAEPGKKYNPLFIYGSSGLGKTHLLHAIASEILRENPRFPLVYVSAQQFAEDFVNALQNNRIEQFRRSQRSVGLWLVDDIQFIANKDKTQEELFHTFNMLQQGNKQIVITSDRPPRDLHFIDERLRSRFESGLVADVLMPDTETRCAILLSKAQQESIALDHDVAMVLAEGVPGTIRALEGALTKLVVHASVNQMPLSTELAAHLVEQYFRSGALAKPSFTQIVDSVSKHFKIPSEDIKGTSRKAPIVHARHIAVYILREITGDSWKHIGTQFGDRDHTSMMHAYQKISEYMHNDRDLKATIKMLIRNLYPEG